MFASFLYVFIPANYTTSGPKFYTKLVLAITRRRKRVRRSYRLESSPNCLNIPNLLSKQDFPKSEFSHKKPLREYLMTCFLYILLLIRFHFILFDFIFILSYRFPIWEPTLKLENSVNSLFLGPRKFQL